MLEKYFENYTNKYHDMKRAFKRYLDLKSDFYDITGTKYDDMPKEKGKILGIDDLMQNIEEQYNIYLTNKISYIEERDKCQQDINKLEFETYRIIIEYAYLDFDCDKKILYNLKRHHKLDYSYGYFRKIKRNAIKEFEKVLKEQKETKRNKREQHN